MLSLLLGVRMCKVLPKFGDASLPDSVISVSDNAKFAVRDNDTLYINRASVSEMSRWGLKPFAVCRVSMYREAGGRFRTLEQLQGFSGIDTGFVARKYREGLLRFDVDTCSSAKSVVSERTTTRRHYSERNHNDRHSASQAPQPRRYRYWSLYYTTPQQYDSIGIDHSVRDSILAYREKYVLKGSLREDSLLNATSHTIWSMVKSHATLRTRRVNTVKTVAPDRPKLELNTANEQQLVALRGIGNYIARNIVSHRDSLGGYVDVRQLLEVRGISGKNYELIAAQVMVDSSRAHKINIKKTTLKRLVVHPYFPRPIAEIICNKVKKGQITNTQELKEVVSYHHFPSFVDSYIYFE